MKKRRDARLKCTCCRRYMRSGPPTEKTPATRRPAPHAGACTDCPPEHTACFCPEYHMDWEERLAIKKEHKKVCPGRNPAAA